MSYWEGIIAFRKTVLMVCTRSPEPTKAHGGRRKRTVVSSRTPRALTDDSVLLPPQVSVVFMTPPRLGAITSSSLALQLQLLVLILIFVAALAAQARAVAGAQAANRTPRTVSATVTHAYVASLRCRPSRRSSTGRTRPTRSTGSSCTLSSATCSRATSGSSIPNRAVRRNRMDTSGNVGVSSSWLMEVILFAVG